MADERNPHQTYFLFDLLTTQILGITQMHAYMSHIMPLLSPCTITLLLTCLKNLAGICFVGVQNFVSHRNRCKLFLLYILLPLQCCFDEIAACCLLFYGIATSEKVSSIHTNACGVEVITEKRLSSRRPSNSTSIMCVN